MKKILVTGATGLVGSRFIELFSDKYIFITPEYPNFDITNLNKTKDFVESSSPDVLVNFAAFTDVNTAENQRGDKNGSCWKINVEGVKNLERIANKNKIHFIQISTDMVFSGREYNPGPYEIDTKPETNPNKLTWYGYTKAQAEIAQTIVRIIYPVRANYALKADYLHGFLAKFDKGEVKVVFNDQQISITFIDEFSLALVKIIDQAKNGIFHVASRNTTTPYELVSYLVEKVRGKKGAIQKSSLKKLIEEGKIPSFRYPIYGGLSVKKTEKKLGMKFSNWKEIVNKLINQGFGS